MLTETEDVTFLEYIMHHPTVLPSIKVDGYDSIDLTELKKHYKLVMLIDNFGGFLFVEKEPDIYEIHTQYLPEGRGRHALKSAKESFNYIFSNKNAKEIRSFVHEGQDHVKRLAVWAGLKKTHSDFAIYTINGKHPLVDYYALTREEWEKNKCQQ